ncbi:Glucosamine-phosphate N-acetyltransferase-like protein [Dispira parvispora]|uniref:Glucosamine 6-phosphate N-acetyltransferase n=1 Tax=Dispira parvispora TaxID=1520584 RepID=A0A9W8AQI4_9FUNG|nr:Glucosamine-phosphate N-acetyltransferase-like protein [Dispira parvispora]
MLSNATVQPETKSNGVSLKQTAEEMSKLSVKEQKVGRRALFDSSLISTEVSAQLPAQYVLRPLCEDDFEKGVFECLSQLSVVGEVSAARFAETFRTLLAQGASYMNVIEDTERSRIVACGTLVLEQKLLRNCGKIGHIEDIVVSSTERGKRLGLHLIHQLKHLGHALGCYKVILNCKQSNVAFYEKCGLEVRDVQMVEYFTE